MAIIDRKNSSLATIKERYCLTKNSSSKQTWHVTLDVSGIDLAYHPGDSIGIYAKNDPILVDHLIQAMQANPEDRVIEKRSKEEISLKTFLCEYANLSRITSSFLKLVHECEECSQKKSKMDLLLEPENKADLKQYLAENDPLGLLQEFSESKLPLQELCDQFAPLLPRFYSIASSKSIHKNTLDLTVALFTWIQREEKRYGVASHFLCHLAEIGKTPIPLFVQPAEHFRIPQDHSTDIIMVGPGTGIAPFRAFVQERGFHSATGKNWLFFGERNKESDFFYEEDWAKHNMRIHAAFSRDQKEKVYVQHKMLEASKDIYEWLMSGAHFYVCGDAKKMAKDVDITLRNILQVEGRLSEEEAKNYLRALKKEGRYLLDVY